MNFKFGLICLVLALSSHAFADASSAAAEPSTKPHEAQLERQKQRAANELEMVTWVNSVAKDSELSNNKLARAMAQDVLFVSDLQQEKVKGINPKVPEPLSAEDKIDLYNANQDVQLRLWHLATSCTANSQAPHCADPLLAESFRKADPGNAFLILVASSIDVGFNSYGLEEEARTLNRAKLIKALASATHYDDFAQDFKAPLLQAVKNRPLPSSWKTMMELPIEAAAIVAAFPEEQLVAQFPPYFISAMLTMPASMLCDQEGKTDKTCERIAMLALKKPSNSLGFMMFLKDDAQNPLVVRAKALAVVGESKDPQAADLLKVNWMGLRSVLAIASKRGDVAAIEPAFAWAEAEVAKLPAKSPEAIAKEATRKAELEAMMKRESADSEARTSAAKEQVEAMKAAEAAAAKAVDEAVNAAGEAARATTPD
jgi:hypothetical protein